MKRRTDVRDTQNFDEVKTQYVVYLKSTIRKILYFFIDSKMCRWYNLIQFGSVIAAERDYRFYWEVFNRWN